MVIIEVDLNCIIQYIICCLNDVERSLCESIIDENVNEERFSWKVDKLVNQNVGFDSRSIG